MCIFICPRTPTLCANCAKSCARGPSDSFQLLENFWDNPICSIGHDQANHCIIVVWRQYATQVQFRYILEKLLSLICELRAYNILGDDTALPAIPTEDRFWIIDEWFPRAVKCGLRFAASKRPDAYFGRLAVSHIQSAAPAALQCRTFEKVEEAREWLDRDGEQVSDRRDDYSS